MEHSHLSRFVAVSFCAFVAAGVLVCAVPSARAQSLPVDTGGFTSTETTSNGMAISTAVIQANRGGGFKGPRSGGPATGTVSGRILTYSGAKYPIAEGKVTFPDCTLYIATDSGLLIPGGTAPGCTPGGGGGTPVIAWATPPSVVAGSVLGPLQLNATANLPGTFMFDPPAGTVLKAGTVTLALTFAPTNLGRYPMATKAVTLVVTPGSGFKGPRGGGPATGKVSDRVLTYNGATYSVVNGKVTFPDCTLYIATDSGLLIPAGMAPGCKPAKD